jgi:hypothetical protein
MPVSSRCAVKTHGSRRHPPPSCRAVTPRWPTCGAALPEDLLFASATHLSDGVEGDRHSAVLKPCCTGQLRFAQGQREELLGAACKADTHTRPSHNQLTRSDYVSQSTGMQTMMPKDLAVC